MFNSHRTQRRTGRMIAAGLVVMIGLLLSACTARGGGSLPPGAAIVDVGDPPVGVDAFFNAKATFGFTLTCGIEKKRAVVRGQLQYQDHSTEINVGPLSFAGVKIHGELDPVITNAKTCEANNLTKVFPNTATFVGRYRPETLDPAIPDSLEEGRFLVQVFDQGEPGRSTTEIDGDNFSIELSGGRFPGYARGGFIEGGNVQVQ